MSDFRSEPLTSKHLKGDFSCGQPALDDYLKKRASQDRRRYAAATFVMVPDSDPRRIAGYYTLSAFSVELQSVPEEMARKLPRYPSIPSLLIGRLARDLAFPGLGQVLLADALRRCVCQSDQIGASLIVVEAKDSRARHFYEKHGFLSVESCPNRLILPMKTAIDAAKATS